MMEQENKEDVNLRQLLGNPKITFVLGKYCLYLKMLVNFVTLLEIIYIGNKYIGGPASGKGT